MLQDQLPIWWGRGGGGQGNRQISATKEVNSCADTIKKTKLVLPVSKITITLNIFLVSSSKILRQGGICTSSL